MVHGPPLFVVEASVQTLVQEKNHSFKGKGEGKTKKMAEQRAAEAILRYLQVDLRQH
jgi:dsRNA-specific ribonuclease